MVRVTGLGHVGIYVPNMRAALEFYTGVLGMTMTDRVGDHVVFLSAQPEREHHEIVLATSTEESTNARHISFTVGTLKDLKALYRKIRDSGCTIDSEVNHGNAIGCYFRDPAGNKLEVYWPTGVDYPQPFSKSINLDTPEDELMAQLKELEPGQRVH